MVVKVLSRWREESSVVDPSTGERLVAPSTMSTDGGDGKRHTIWRRDRYPGREA